MPLITTPDAHARKKDKGIESRPPASRSTRSFFPTIYPNGGPPSPNPILLQTCPHNSIPTPTPLPNSSTPPTFLLLLVVKIPNLKNTSLHVTSMLSKIKTMMIQVKRSILLSEMYSERISARSRKTRQRSFRTWIRGFISRYSRTAL